MTGAAQMCWIDSRQVVSPGTVKPTKEQSGNKNSKQYQRHAVHRCKEIEPGEGNQRWPKKNAHTMALRHDSDDQQGKDQQPIGPELLLIQQLWNDKIGIQIVEGDDKNVKLLTNNTAMSSI